MDESLSVAMQALRSKAASSAEELRSTPAMAELIKIHAALNTIEELANAERTSLSDLLGLGGGSLPSPREAVVKVGEFFGKAPLEAAKAYLKKKGKPAKFDEIVDNLALGSCEVANKNELRVSLGRSSFEIAKLSEDDFALLDWFPEVKKNRLQGARRRASNGAISADDSSESQGSVPRGEIDLQ